MAVKPIRLFGDPVLRTPAEPVKDFDKELRTLVKDLSVAEREFVAIARALEGESRVLLLDEPVKPVHSFNPLVQISTDVAEETRV